MLAADRESASCESQEEGAQGMATSASRGLLIEFDAIDAAGSCLAVTLLVGCASHPLLLSRPAGSFGAQDKRMVEKNGVEVGSVHATWSVKGALERPVVPDSVKIGFPRSWPSAWASLARATVISVFSRCVFGFGFGCQVNKCTVRASAVARSNKRRSIDRLLYFGHAM